jgi:hypothetical protein
MNMLWTFGCSFTAEYYPVGDVDHRSTYDDYKDWRGGTLPPIWPTILSNKLNIDLHNRGVGGASNYLILNQFLEIAHQVKENDILIFGWTNLCRFQLVNTDEDKFNQILPAVESFPGIYVNHDALQEIFVNRTHPLWMTEIDMWIRFINLYTHKIGAHIFHWTSDHALSGFFKQNYKDDHRYILGNVNMEQTIMSEINYNTELICGKDIAKINAETNGLVDDCHYGQYGHETQSKIFYDHIIKFLP